MKIGVVSDTHSYEIPQQLLNDFKKVDLIIHAGDFCTVEDLNIFKSMANVRGVSGNMDGLELRQIFPERDVFKVDGLTVGLIHGRGAPDHVLGIVQSEFKNEKVDIVIFGHSHHPVNETINGVLYFNPGSPNDTVRAPYCSYGILEVNKGAATAKIIKIKE